MSNSSLIPHSPFYPRLSFFKSDKQREKVDLCCYFRLQSCLQKVCLLNFQTVHLQLSIRVTWLCESFSEPISGRKIGIDWSFFMSCALSKSQHTTKAIELNHIQNVKGITVVLVHGASSTACVIDNLRTFDYSEKF